jgi:hypothetical protein
LYGEILPGERVGRFKLGTSLEEVKSDIDFEYIVKDGYECTLLETEGMSFFVRNNQLIQITVHESFMGKLFGKIGIGSILAEFKDILEYELDEEDNDCRFYSQKYPGINFRLTGWDDDNSPIKFMSIFKNHL